VTKSVNSALNPTHALFALMIAEEFWMRDNAFASKDSMYLKINYFAKVLPLTN
jgi:hypothetical protein